MLWKVLVLTQNIGEACYLRYGTLTLFRLIATYYFLSLFLSFQGVPGYAVSFYFTDESIMWESIQSFIVVKYVFEELS